MEFYEPFHEVCNLIRNGKLQLALELINNRVELADPAHRFSQTKGVFEYASRFGTCDFLKKIHSFYSWLDLSKFRCMAASADNLSTFKYIIEETLQKYPQDPKYWITQPLMWAIKGNAFIVLKYLLSKFSFHFVVPCNFIYSKTMLMILLSYKCTIDIINIEDRVTFEMTRASSNSIMLPHYLIC